MRIRFLFSAVVLSTAFVGCGLIGGDNRRESAAQPTPAAPEPRRETRDTREADALFNEFFDAAPVTPPPVQEFTLPDPVSQPDPVAPAPRHFRLIPGGGRFVVQVTNVASPSLADHHARRFQRMGFPAYVARVENPTPRLIGTFYRVRIGGFATVTEARNFGEVELMSRGYDFWIDNRSNDNVGIGGAGLGNFTTRQPVAQPAAQPVPQPAAQQPVVQQQPPATPVTLPATVFTPTPEPEEQAVVEEVVATPAQPEIPPFEVDADAPFDTTGWDNFYW